MSETPPEIQEEGVTEQWIPSLGRYVKTKIVVNPIPDDDGKYYTRVVNTDDYTTLESWYADNPNGFKPLPVQAAEAPVPEDQGEQLPPDPENPGDDEG